MTAKKKDFSNINDKVQAAMADATAEPETTAPKKNKPRKTYTQNETQAHMDDLTTSGRKGMHLPRINMAFSPEHYDYIKTMSRVSGISLTEFLNNVIAKDMAANRALYEKALEFRNSL